MKKMAGSKKRGSSIKTRTVSFTFQEGGPILGVGHFLEEIRKFAGRGDHRIYFRGHGRPTGSLLPSIGRNQYYLGRSRCFSEHTERDLLKQFRRHAYEHFGRIPSPWETLFLARHHGLPTRLLDWTSNPLVALYFAAFYDDEPPANSEDHERSAHAKSNLHGTIWAIQPRHKISELDIFNESRDPLEISGIKLLFPFNPTPRMTAQSGIFTLHGDPRTDVVQCAGKPYRPGDLDLLKLTRWTVERSSKAAIILDLERLSINSRTLFPDLEGLARGLWQTEIIRTCFKDSEDLNDQ
jgi:hypothetical protein